MTTFLSKRRFVGAFPDWKAGRVGGGNLCRIPHCDVLGCEFKARRVDADATRFNFAIRQAFVCRRESLQPQLTPVPWFRRRRRCAYGPHSQSQGQSDARPT